MSVQGVRRRFTTSTWNGRQKRGEGGRRAKVGFLNGRERQRSWKRKLALGAAGATNELQRAKASAIDAGEGEEPCDGCHDRATEQAGRLRSEWNAGRLADWQCARSAEEGKGGWERVRERASERARREGERESRVE